VKFKDMQKVLVYVAKAIETTALTFQLQIKQPLHPTLPPPVPRFISAPPQSTQGKDTGNEVALQF